MADTGLDEAASAQAVVTDLGFVVEGDLAVRG